MDLIKLPIHRLREMLSAGKITCVELVQAYIDEIKKTNDSINGYIEVFEDEALEQARQTDADEAKKALPLGGIPIAIKDNLCYKGHETSCASNILKGYKAPYNAHVIDRLLENGAIIIGRTNMDEFAMGSSTETSCYAETNNPWNTECVPGGSSGGSAAVVAAYQAASSLGSDTGGSIRQPAALCGTVGLKPTYGRVSRYGLLAFGSSLDQIGHFCKDAKDCALLLGIIAGYDKRDSTSINTPVPDYTKALEEDTTGFTIGIPREYFAKGIDPEVEKSVKDAIALLEKNGAVVKEISMPHTEYAVPTYYLVATAEASSNLARYDGVQYGLRDTSEPDLNSMYFNTRQQGFGTEVKRRILLGTYALSSGYYDAYYLKALKVRNLIKGDFDKAFEECDVVITPTSPTPAFKKGEKTSDPLAMYLADIYTISTNLAGLPGMSIPCGLTSGNLPIGLQLIGKPFGEETLFKVAGLFEKLSGTSLVTLKEKCQL